MLPIVRLERFVLVISILLITACSDERDKVAEGEHVWKDQTQALEKAQGVEQVVHDANMQQRQHIDEQLQ